MSGRRSHPRFLLSEPWHGSLRLLRDVIVDRTGPDELLAVCHSAGMRGEELSLELMGAAQTMILRVEVLESRPVIVDGSVRHRVRLGILPDHAPCCSTLVTAPGPPRVEAVS